MKIPGYDIMRPLAKGGNATVFLAVQHSLGRKVAVKILRKGDRPSDAVRFMEEGRIVASLSHRNVITVYDVGVTDHWYYIAMEYLRGGSLEDRIREGMSVPAILDLTTTIAGCLDFLHKKGIVHRDVKPANILFHEDGTPKLTDFGIAKQVHGDQELTMDGAAIGSPYYLSPEQAGARPLDGRSDIYSLGVVFFEMLTGEKPFRGNSHVETMMAQISQPIPELPEPLTAFQELLDRMVAKDPKDRFDSAAELLGYLEAVQRFVSRLSRAPGERREEAPPPAEPAALPARRSGGAKGNRGTKAALFALGAIALVVTGALLFVKITGDGPSRPEVATASAPVSEPVSKPVSKLTPIPEDPGSYMDGRSLPESTPSVPKPPIDESAMAEPPVADPAVEETASTQTETGEEETSEPAPEATPLDLPVPEVAQTGDPAEWVPERMKWPVLVLKNDAEPSPPVASPERIEEWLVEARSAMQDYRLTTPPDDNAYHYYRQVLEAEPDNAEALQGRRDIANIYASLARRKLGAADASTASLYVSRGLMVEPGHGELVALQGSLKQPKQAQAPASKDDSGSDLFGKVRNFFTDPPASGEKRQSILEH